MDKQKTKFGKEFVITNEKDKCIKCGRKIYKDKIVTRTSKGYVCYKCKFTGSKGVSRSYGTPCVIIKMEKQIPEKAEEDDDLLNYEHSAYQDEYNKIKKSDGWYK